MERHTNEADSSVVVPIILRSCLWQDSIFAKLQALPKNAKPISTWPDKDEAYVDAAKGLKSLIHRINDKRNGAQGASVKSTENTASNNSIQNTTVNNTPNSIDPNEFKKLVAAGKTKKAIEQLMEFTKDKDVDSYNQLIHLSSRLNALKRDNNMGLITNQESNRTNAQITYALLEMLKDL